jgi:hypothetical protein
MAIMSTWAIVFLLESLLLFTTLGIMGFFGFMILMTRFSINILRTELLPALPTPRSAATGTDEKLICASGKPTRKNVITRIILQAPPLAPGALLGVHLQRSPKGIVVILLSR